MSAQDQVAALGSIMVVGAHPDDETFIAGGIMAMAVANGQDVVCVTATRGEAGVQDETLWPKKELGNIRENELQAALQELGVTKHYWLGCEDGKCSQANADEVVDRLSKIIEQHKPDTILSFGADGLTGHDDHQTVSRWVDTAVAQQSDQPVVLYAVITEDQYEKYMQQMDEKLNMFFNIDNPPIFKPQDCDVCVTLPEKVCKQKYRAFAAMPSQTKQMQQSFDETFLSRAFCVESFVKN